MRARFFRIIHLFTHTIGEKIVFFVLLVFLFFFLFYQKPIRLLTKESILLWYNTLLPCLFPCMILSNCFLYLFRNQDISNNPCQKVLCRIFHCCPYGLSVLLLGFLCGFPTGSFLCAKLYKEKKLNHKEATVLLSFCNNLSPAYVIGILCSHLERIEKISAIGIFYAVPLLYGICLGFTNKDAEFIKKSHTFSKKESASYFSMLDYAISDSLKAIISLAGYVICFRLFLLIPMRFSNVFSKNVSEILYFIIDTSSGYDIMSACPSSLMNHLFLGLCTTGGICQLAQTACMLAGSGLSLKEYIPHKLTQGLLVTAVWSLLQYFIV